MSIVLSRSALGSFFAVASELAVVAASVLPVVVFVAVVAPLDVVVAAVVALPVVVAGSAPLRLFPWLRVSMFE